MLLDHGNNTHENNCVKRVRILSFSGPYFPTFGLNTEKYGVRMRENTDQKNSEHAHFLCNLTLVIKTEKQRKRKTLEKKGKI